MSEFLFLLEIIMKNINFHANNIKTKSQTIICKYNANQNQDSIEFLSLIAKRHVLITHLTHVAIWK